MSLPKKIVIVEDEVITQRFLQDIFAQYDTTVVGCFDNAADLLAHIKDLSCDMILMDINIKGPMDGIQLARKLLEKYTVPIIVFAIRKPVWRNTTSEHLSQVW